MPEAADQSQGTNQSQGAADQSKSGQSNAAASGGSNSNQETAGQQNSQQNQQQAAKPDRPAYVPEAHWDGDKGAPKETFGQYVNDHVAFKAAQDSRKLTLPANPDAYKVELPADLKFPEGVKFAFDDKDPLLAQARTMAHEMGIDQPGFSKLLGLYAATRVGEKQHFETSKAAQVAKLGPNSAARVDAVTAWLTAMGGDKSKALVGVINYAPVAETVEAIEELMRKFSAQGASEFSQAHRASPAQNGKIPGYEGMNFEQKRQAQDRLTNPAR